MIDVTIKDMRPATDQGKTVAYFEAEIRSELGQLLMTLKECKVIEGANGLFAGMYSKTYTQAGAKRYKQIVKLERVMQEKINAVAVAAYQRMGGVPAAPEPDIPW